MDRRPEPLSVALNPLAMHVELEYRLKVENTYDVVFADLAQPINEIVHVVYKTLGEYAGRTIVYVFSYDTFTLRRVPINQMFYRSTGTSRGALTEGLWFPMTQFKHEFNSTGYRIGKLEDEYLMDDHLDQYLKGVKLHPEDDIARYGRYLRKDLAVVGGWLTTRWIPPTTMATVDPELLIVDQTSVLEIHFRRLMDLKFFLDMFVDEEPTMRTSIDNTTMSFVFASHVPMMEFYDKIRLSDVFVQTMLGIKYVRVH